MKCAGCSLNFEAPPESAGKQGECPHCGAVCSIPGKPEEKAAVEVFDERKAPALVPCPACGRKISNFAEFCPGCGHKSGTGPGQTGGKGGFEAVVLLLEDIVTELKKLSGEF